MVLTALLVWLWQSQGNGLNQLPPCLPHPSPSPQERDLERPNNFDDQKRTQDKSGHLRHLSFPETWISESMIHIHSEKSLVFHLQSRGFHHVRPPPRWSDKAPIIGTSIQKRSPRRGRAYRRRSNMVISKSWNRILCQALGYVARIDLKPPVCKGVGPWNRMNMDCKK